MRETHPIRSWRATLVLCSCPYFLFFLTLGPARAGEANAGATEGSAPEETASSAAEIKALIPRLLRDLDSDQRKRRIDAERELLDLGPSILDKLPAPELIANPEVRTRVSKIRKVLELRKATESVQPSHVTTTGGVRFEQFLKEVESQTGNSIDRTRLTATELQTPIHLSNQKVPFWSALETASHQVGVTGDFNPEAPALLLRTAASGTSRSELSVTEAGPFRVALESLKIRDIAGTDQKRLRAEISVTPEPRLRALFLKFQAKDFLALTTDGTRLLPADPDAQLDLPLGEGGHHVRWSLDFLVPASLSKVPFDQIRVRGQANMQIAAGSAHIRIRELASAQGVSRRKGGVTVSLVKVKRTETANSMADVSVQIQVAYDTGGPAFESHRTWIFHNQVYLESPENEGRYFANGGYETNQQANGLVGVTYRFQGVKEPLEQLHFVYVAPTLIIDTPFMFELKTGQILGTAK